jgi:hypothetical protein
MKFIILFLFKSFTKYLINIWEFRLNIYIARRKSDASMHVFLYILSDRANILVLESL